MTIKKSNDGQKLNKVEKKHKRDEATRLVNAMFSNRETVNEHIEKFSKLIDELDASKDPNSRKKPDGKPISSIFDLADIHREKKYLLEKWVSQYKESLTKTQPKVESSSMTAA